jgi:hypothetical protein
LFLLAAIAVRLPVLLAGSDVRFSLLADDAFYYLEAARRTVESGSWPSMDGVNPTNGFHPLYMLLVLGLTRLVGNDPAAMIATVFSINLMLNTISALILFSSIASRVPRGVAILVGLLLSLSPGWASHGFAGVENSLSSLLLLILALRWRDALSLTAIGESRVILRDLGDGCLAGFVMLARTDGALFVGLGLLVLVIDRARRVGTSAALAGGMRCAAVAGVIVLPWLWINTLEFGGIAQDSATAIAARTAELAGDAGSPSWFRLIAMNLSFWAYRLSWFWGLVPLTAWLIGMQVPWKGRRVGAIWRWRILVLLPVLCVLAVALRGNDLWYIDRERTAALELLLAGVAGVAGLLTARETPRQWNAWSTLIGLWFVTSVVLYALGL